MSEWFQFATDSSIELLKLTAVALVIAIGMIGTLVPVLPGPLIVWLGILLHFLLFPDNTLTPFYLGVTFVLMIIAFVLDALCAWLGAKRFGGSRSASIGALLGGLFGIFLPPPLLWIFLGPPLGALLGEYMDKGNWSGATRCGWGTFLGGMLAFSLKISIAAAMVLILLLSVYF